MGCPTPTSDRFKTSGGQMADRTASGRRMAGRMADNTASGGQSTVKRGNSGETQDQTNTRKSQRLQITDASNQIASAGECTLIYCVVVEWRVVAFEDVTGWCRCLIDWLAGCLTPRSLAGWPTTCPSKANLHFVSGGPLVGGPPSVCPPTICTRCRHCGMPLQALWDAADAAAADRSVGRHMVSLCDGLARCSVEN